MQEDHTGSEQGETQARETVAYWDCRRVAAFYGVSTPSVWRWSRIGVIPSPIKVGRLTRWRATEVMSHRFSTRLPRPAVVAK